MSAPDTVFVNSPAIHGFMNGVVNVTFSTNKHSVDKTDPANPKVIVAEVLTLDLRMDLWCAEQLYAALGKIIQANTKPAANETN